MGLVSPDAFTAIAPTLAGTLTAAQISNYVAAAELSAGRYVGFQLEQSTETIFMDGSGHPDQILPRRPVANVASVYLDRSGANGQNPDGAFASENLLTVGTHYTWTKDGKLTCLALPSAWYGIAFGSGWPTGRFGRWGFPGLSAPGGKWVCWPALPGCVKVTYTAGFTAADVDIVRAIVEIAAYQAQVTESGGVIGTSISFIDVSESVGFLTEALRSGNAPALGSARQALDQIKEPRIAVGIF